MPCLAKPMTMTVRMTRQASAKVTAIWLVTVKEPGTMPKKLAQQHEHEQREDEGEEFQPVLAGRGMDHVGDEFVGDFRHGLGAGRHQPARLDRQGKKQARPRRPRCTISSD